MKIRQVVLGLVGVIGLFLAYEVGRHSVSPPTFNNKPIYISASPAPAAGKCQAMPPKIGVHYETDTVQWVSTDKPYWVSFITIKQPPGYQPENPLISASDPVYVPAGGQSSMYNLEKKVKYYYYAIYDHDPQGDKSNPCKDASDVTDPGLNVKP